MKKNEYKLDKTHIEIGTASDFDDEVTDILYWQSKTPLERLQALEFLRQTMYNYDPVSGRVQRVFETFKR